LYRRDHWDNPSITKQEEPGKERFVEPFHIKDILLFSSSYHFYQLEEEGRLSFLLQEYDASYGRKTPLKITHVETKEDCLRLLIDQPFDLVILFDKLNEVESYVFAKQIKTISNIPIVLLGNNLAELMKLKRKTQITFLVKSSHGMGWKNHSYHHPTA